MKVVGCLLKSWGGVGGTDSFFRENVFFFEGCVYYGTKTLGGGVFVLTNG